MKGFEEYHFLYMLKHELKNSLLFHNSFSKMKKLNPKENIYQLISKILITCMPVLFIALISPEKLI